MKIARIALLLILSMLALTVMTGCRCVPAKENWYFYSYKEDMVFMGGVTRNLGFADASNVYPFAEPKSPDIGISFSKDGKVEFTPNDGKTLYGTYTYEHTSINYTSFTITLENGEKIEGNSYKNMRTKRLALTYKGVIYNFSDEKKSGYTTIDTVIANIKAGDREGLNEAVVVQDGERLLVRFSEMVAFPISTETAVFAVRIHRDGTYTILDEISEGEVLSTYNDSANYIVIYYLDK